MDVGMKSVLDLSQRSVENAKDQQLLKGPEGMAPEEIRKVAQDFESLFLEIVLKSMRSSVSKSGLMDGGNGEDIFRGMLDGEYAKQMAAQRSSGIASSIENQLLSVLKDRKEFMEAAQGKAAYQGQAGRVK